MELNISFLGLFAAYLSILIRNLTCFLDFCSNFVGISRIDDPQKIWTHLSFCERFGVNLQILFEVLVITDDPATASTPWLAPA